MPVHGRISHFETFFHAVMQHATGAVHNPLSKAFPNAGMPAYGAIHNSIRVVENNPTRLSGVGLSAGFAHEPTPLQMLLTI